jgi:Mg2+ and Co2+ transporter CorA
MASNGFVIDGNTIEYAVKNQQDHYKFDSAYASTLVTEDVLIMFSQTGNVKYGNKHFIDRLRISRRGFHYGANKSEQDIGVFKRVYKDDSKRHRLGFEVDIDRALEILTMTPEDVLDLPRGNALKHFVMQRTTMIRYDRKLKQLRRVMKRQKKQEDRERYAAQIREINTKKIKLDSYIEERRNKANKSISDAKNKTFSREEVTESFLMFAIGAGAKPPEQHVN